MTTAYCILTNNSPNFKAYYDYFYYRNPVEKNTYDAAFVYIGHHDIGLDWYINPNKVLSIFNYLIKEHFTVIQIEIFGLSFNTEHFTHFIEYKIPINATLSYFLVFYLNIEDQSIYKYSISIVDRNLESVHNTIYTQTYKYECDLDQDYGYVSYDCLELGFAVAVNRIFTPEPICKSCHYYSRNLFLPCTIHPLVNHKIVTDCNDYKSRIIIS
jgi:hypothetical protein